MSQRRIRRASFFTAVVAGGAASSSACVFWDMGDWSRGAARDDTSGFADGSAGATRDASDERAPSTPASGYAAAVLADAPLGYWPLDETTGVVARDASGNGRDATLEGNVSWGAPGALAAGFGATFSGGRMVVGDAFGFIGTSEMSLEAWVRPSMIDDIYRRAGGKESPSSPRAGYDLWLRRAAQADPRIGFERLVDDKGVSVSAPVPTGSAFFHVVATYAGGTMTLWINGEMAASISDARSMASHSGAFAWGNSSYSPAPFAGVLDEVAVYGAALDATRVRAHYAAARAP